MKTDKEEMLQEVAKDGAKLCRKYGISRDNIIGRIFHEAAEIAARAVTKVSEKTDLDRRIDDIVTSKLWGYPLMLGLLTLVFWLTIAGANVPSRLLSELLFGFQDILSEWFQLWQAPEWLHGLLVLGLYRCLAWVVAVMLPPMAIFFPLFTFLEDLGYLPRVAFNLDAFFKRAGAHGKQVLTMCMGFGCNAAGITSCRIIDSPRERLIAILTNNFVPCNGRFPLLITMGTILGLLFSGEYNAVYSAFVVALAVILGIGVSLVVSYGLSRSILRGIPSTFTLELPPYRCPKIGELLVRSILDRTLFVLMRAIAVAAPAGALIWLLANVPCGGETLLQVLAGGLDGFGRFIGLDGIILLAFILGFPANEIVMPLMVMGYLAQGSMADFESVDSLREILINNGWTWVTIVNVMLFSLLHFPCATTLLTIKKETGSWKWSLFAAGLPTAIACLVCLVVRLIF